MKKAKKLWYSVMFGEHTEWDYGSFSWEEAVKMAKSEYENDTTTYIVAIDGGYDDNGEPTRNILCVGTYGAYEWDYGEPKQ